MSFGSVGAGSDPGIDADRVHSSPFDRPRVAFGVAVRAVGRGDCAVSIRFGSVASTDAFPAMPSRQETVTYYLVSYGTSRAASRNDFRSWRCPRRRVRDSVTADSGGCGAASDNLPTRSASATSPVIRRRWRLQRAEPPSTRWPSRRNSSSEAPRRRSPARPRPERGSAPDVRSRRTISPVPDPRRETRFGPRLLSLVCGGGPEGGSFRPSTPMRGSGERR